jgi:hypothetical protein
MLLSFELEKKPQLDAFSRSPHTTTSTKLERGPPLSKTKIEKPT